MLPHRWLNVNFLNRNKILLGKQHYDSLPLGSTFSLKIYGFLLFHSTHQLIVEPTRITECIKALIGPHFNKLSRKIDSEWCFGNGITWFWANILLNKNVILEIKWTLKDFNKVNEEWSRLNFCETIKVNKISWLFKLYLCEPCLWGLCYVVYLKSFFCAN